MPEQSDNDYISAMSSDYHRYRMGTALRMLKSKSPIIGKTAFDFGCGEGSFMRLLAAENVEVSGCDPSSTLSPDIIGGVEVLEKIAPVDIFCVLSVLSFMDKKEQARFWKLAPRTVKPGGYMIFVCANGPVSGTRRNFGADPKTFPAALLAHGFKETARDFSGMYRTPVERWLGFHERVMNPVLLKLIPETIKARRCTLYFSLSEKV